MVVYVWSIGYTAPIHCIRLSSVSVFMTRCGAVVTPHGLDQSVSRPPCAADPSRLYPSAPDLKGPRRVLQPCERIFGTLLGSPDSMRLGPFSPEADLCCRPSARVLWGGGAPAKNPQGPHSPMKVFLSLFCGVPNFHDLDHSVLRLPCAGDSPRRPC